MKYIYIGTAKEIGLRCLEWAKKNTPKGYKIINNKEKCDIFISVLYDKILNDNRFEMYAIVEDGKVNDNSYCYPAGNRIVGVCGLTYIDWVNRHCDLHFYIGENFKWID